MDAWEDRGVNGQINQKWLHLLLIGIFSSSNYVRASHTVDTAELIIQQKCEHFILHFLVATFFKNKNKWKQYILIQSKVYKRL